MIQDQDEINDIIQDLKDDFYAYIVPPHSDMITGTYKNTDYSFSITIPCEKTNRDVTWEELYPYIEELESRLDEIGYFIWAHRIYYTIGEDIGSTNSDNYDGEIVNTSFLDKGEIKKMKDHYNIKSAILWIANKKEHTGVNRVIKNFKTFTKETGKFGKGIIRTFKDILTGNID